MSCQAVRMKDGTVVLAHLKPGAKLTPDEERAIAEYAHFCRDRSAKKRLAKAKAAR